MYIVVRATGRSVSQESMMFETCCSVYGQYELTCTYKLIIFMIGSPYYEVTLEVVWSLILYTR